MAHFKVQTCEYTYKYTYETGALKKPGASHLKGKWEGCLQVLLLFIPCMLAQLVFLIK